MEDGQEQSSDTCDGSGGRVESLPFDLSAVEYVLAAADFGSFRSAAESLRIYPATVSRAVRKIEDAIGVSLFERNAGGVRLTKAGREFACRAAAGLHQLSQAARIAASAGRAEVGLIRIGVMTTLAGGFLRELIADYRLHHHQVVIEIHDGSHRDHLAGIRKRSLDVAFVAGVDSFSDCVSTPLWTERICLALSGSHELAGCECIDWKDLKEQQSLVTQTDPGPEFRDYIRRQVASHGGIAAVSSCPVLADTLLHLVGLGEGIAVVPATWGEMSIPHVVLRSLADEDDILSWNMVWSPRNDNPALRRFISRSRALAVRSTQVRPGINP